MPFGKGQPQPIRKQSAPRKQRWLKATRKKAREEVKEEIEVDELPQENTDFDEDEDYDEDDNEDEEGDDDESKDGDEEFDNDYDEKDGKAFSRERQLRMEEKQSLGMDVILEEEV